ncbi:hypothetical protein B0H11DRAFT_2261800 [Mycena galericulata]|nr:hypothetical protein B0H11DRAFT_2261800 [Mycena galericulata]
MSSSRSQHPRASLPPRHFERLSAILAEANKHHSAVAAAARAAKRPTHHARSRAQKLGLSVCIKLAVACDERLVSVIPLPVLDRASPEPTQAPALPPRQRGRPTLRLIVPRAPADVPTSTGPYSSVSLSAGGAPAPAAAPTVLRGQNVPWRGPTSRFSLTPDDPLFTLAPRRAPEPPVVPVIPDVPFDEEEAERFFETCELMYPESGAADYASSTSSYASSCASSSSECSPSSSSNSSASSSSGPVTPADAEMPPIATLSSKRRREPEAIVDKRPKYERKSWARAPRKLL